MQFANKAVCGCLVYYAIRLEYVMLIAAGATDTSSSKEDTSPFIEFGDDDDDFDVDEARRKQDEEFDFGAMMKQSAADSKQKDSAQGLVSLVVVRCC